MGSPGSYKVPYKDTRFVAQDTVCNGSTLDDRFSNLNQNHTQKFEFSVKHDMKPSHNHYSPSKAGTKFGNSKKQKVDSYTTKGFPFQEFEAKTNSSELKPIPKNVEEKVIRLFNIYPEGIQLEKV